MYLSRIHKQLLSRLYLFVILSLGDTLVYDRYKYIKKYLPRFNGQSPKLLDVGCGSGAFTLYAAYQGYKACGLSWDVTNQNKACQRSKVLDLQNYTDFPIFDARDLHSFPTKDFDVILCLENAEHIIDDNKLFADLYSLLKPNGYLLFSAPNYFYKPITSGDNGPFSTTEDGWHVRRGYSKSELVHKLTQAGFAIDSISYCSGFISQKVTWSIRVLSRYLPYPIVYLLTYPLRILSIVFGDILLFLPYPAFSITAVAYKF